MRPSLLLLLLLLFPKQQNAPPRPMINVELCECDCCCCRLEMENVRSNSDSIDRTKRGGRLDWNGWRRFRSFACRQAVPSALSLSLSLSPTGTPSLPFPFPSPTAIHSPPTKTHPRHIHTQRGGGVCRARMPKCQRRQRARLARPPAATDLGQRGSVSDGADGLSL